MEFRANSSNLCNEMFEAFFFYINERFYSRKSSCEYINLLNQGKEWSILLDEAVSLLEKYKFVIMGIRDFARHFYLLIFIYVDRV